MSGGRHSSILAVVKREIFSVKRLPSSLVVAYFQLVTDMLKKGVKMEWISDGLARRALRPLARSDKPSVGWVKESWRLDQPEKVALVDQDIEFRGAVPSIIPVVEINPKPNAPFAVVHVNGSAIERVRMGKKDHHGRGELNPSKNFREFGKLEELCRSFI